MDLSAKSYWFGRHLSKTSKLVFYQWHIYKGVLKASLFTNSLFLHRESNYLTDDTMWAMCTAPNNIVQFHIGLFATLLAVSGLEVILCAIQMINGLFGCLCGTCTDKGVCWSKLRVRYVRATFVKKKLVLNPCFCFQPL